MTAERIIPWKSLRGQQWAEFSPRTHPEVSFPFCPFITGLWSETMAVALLSDSWAWIAQVRQYPGVPRESKTKGLKRNVSRSFDNSIGVNITVLVDFSIKLTSLFWLFHWQMVNVKLSRWWMEKRNIRPIVTRSCSIGNVHVLFLLLLSQREITVIHCWFFLKPLVYNTNDNTMKTVSRLGLQWTYYIEKIYSFFISLHTIKRPSRCSVIRDSIDHSSTDYQNT